jgi:hypothetical protein
MPTKPLELRLVGQGVAPERLDVADVLSLIKSYRDALVAIRPNEQDAISTTPPVALVGIKSGSARFQIIVAPRLKPAVSTVARAVLASDFEQLPAVARRALKSIVNLLKESGRSLQLPAFRKQRPTLAATTVIPTQREDTYSAATTLYGRIRLTGGALSTETGRAELVLGDGTQVRLHGDKVLIKRLGANLYEEIGVHGVASWDSATNIPFEMKVEGLHEFPTPDVASAFTRLAKATGTHWDHVDPADYVRSLRSDDG